jgi:plasmid stability protein
MAQLLVRNLEEQLKTRLQRRARRHGRSMEEEARDILRHALRNEETPAGGLGSEIAALFREKGLEEEIPELRGYPIRPASFEP